jgi:hypothetical protein
MKCRLLISLIVASFVLGSQAYAVRFVAKDDPASKQETSQRPEDSRKAPDTGRNLPQPQIPPERNEVKRLPERERPPANDRDRFIDENGDGINDKLQKPPEVIKKKRDTRPEHPGRPSHPEKPDQSKKRSR